MGSLQIQFRAWLVNAQRMINVEEINFYNKTINFIEDLDNVVLMQYTGLEDKNGVEIYEGDIVHWKDMFTSEGWEDTCKVVWQEEEAGFYMQSLSTPKAAPDTLGWYDNCLELEVIGNVYEDKEFLKGFENE